MRQYTQVTQSTEHLTRAIAEAKIKHGLFHPNTIKAKIRLCDAAEDFWISMLQKAQKERTLIIQKKPNLKRLTRLDSLIRECNERKDAFSKEIDDLEKQLPPSQP